MLEVPEETFVEQHRFDAEGMSFCAYISIAAPYVPFPSILTRVHFSTLHKVVSMQRTYLAALACTLSDRDSFPRSAEDEEKTKNVWMKGHTDSGTISLLWSQPVVALQIMSTDGKWRYVKHVPNGIVRPTYLFHTPTFP